MMQKKTCFKCGGHMMLERDVQGWYEQCLQCAYMRDLVDQPPVIVPLTELEFTACL